MDAPEITGPIKLTRSSLVERWIPATLAIVATLMAVFQVIASAQGDDEIKGASEIGSNWAYFQAKSTKEHMIHVARDQLEVMAAAMPGGAKEAQALIGKYNKQIAQYEAEKDDIKRKTDAMQAVNTKLGEKGDRYDVSSAIFSVALAFLALAQLRGSGRMFLVSVSLSALATGFGIWGVLL